MLAKSARRARRLRREPTRAEVALWRALRERAVAGLKFRRQHPIDRYTADFACIQLKLVIEVDGGVHFWDDDRVLRDMARTEIIEARGWCVMRVSNKEVFEDLDGVLARIGNEVKIIRGG
jgi:very-short-patch-repair endonuclease